MLVVLGCALLVLAVGMVVLFAMFGELSARVDQAGKVRRNTEVRVLEKVRLGQVPQSWPPSIPGPGSDLFTLLVLSSACVTCTDIATQLVSDPGHTDWANMGVVISTAHRDTGADFVDRHQLARVPHYVDEGGDWVSGEFDVRMSPSALVFRDGMLTEAYMFQDVAALRAMLDRAPTLERHE